MQKPQAVDGNKETVFGEQTIHGYEFTATELHKTWQAQVRKFQVRRPGVRMKYLQAKQLLIIDSCWKKESTLLMCRPWWVDSALVEGHTFSSIWTAPAVLDRVLKIENSELGGYGKEHESGTREGQQMWSKHIA